MDDQVTREPTSRLIAGIFDDAEQLLRKELALAKQETREELSKLRTHAMLIGGGALGASIAALLLLSALALGISSALEWPAWAGFALVGTLVAIASVAVLATAPGAARRDVRNVQVQARALKESIQDDVSALRPAAEGRS